jgi:hypothetical protein
VWDPIEQRCKKIIGLGFLMAEDFYTDDWGYDDASYYYDGGGGGDYYGSGGDDFYYGYGAGETQPIDYLPSQETTYFDFGQGYDTGLWQGFESQQVGGDDLYSAYWNYYMGLGYDPLVAADLAYEDASAGSIQTITSEQAPAPELPEIFPYYGLPYVPDYYQSPPYIELPEGPYYPLPPSPQEQLPTQQPNLPPYCPQGQYHPYPIGHPQQNICVPFPAAPTPQTQQRLPGQQPTGQTQAPRPAEQPRPTQQQCPTGYYRAPTGQCLPIPRCTTPGTVFDQATGRCVPQGQAVSPLPIPSEAKDLWANLKELPWWLWVALAGLLLLGKDDDGRKTTVVHRRAG